MKNTCFIIAGIAMLSLSSCKDKTAEDSLSDKAIAADTTEVVKDATSMTTDTTAVVKRESKNASFNLAVAGTVTAVTNGKDGYTATVLNSRDNVVYDVVISRVDLKEQYKPASVGDRVLVLGEHYKVGERATVKATSLKIKAAR